MTDGELLASYAREGNEEGFRQVVERHAPMVLAACRRQAGPDADDAAQAVFLILARKAARLTSHRDLGSWLYRTAGYVAGHAARSRSRRRAREKEAIVIRNRTDSGAAPDTGRRQELRRSLDAAMSGLPRRYREVMVLCYLQGVPQREAARRLGLPAGTVAARCSRGLAKLRARLAGGGLPLTAVALGAALLEEATSTTATEEFVRSTLGAAAGKSPGGTAAALAKGGMQAMTLVRIKTGVAAALALAVLGGGGLLVKGIRAAEPAKNLNPRIAAMSDNSWLRLKPEREPRSRMYSGCWLGEGVLMFFGGGHGAYKYNDVELYHIAANRWERATEKEAWTEVKGAGGMGGGWGVPVLSPKTRPLGEHTYQQFCWLPGRKKFFGRITPGTWEFDPEKKEWKCLAGLHAGKAGRLTPAEFKKVKNHYNVTAWKTGDGRVVSREKRGAPWTTRDGKPAPDVGSFQPSQATGGGLVIYDPVTKKPLCLEGGMAEGRTLWAFDHQKMAWEKLLFARVRKSVSNYSTWVPDRKAHLITATDSWYWLDTAARKVTQIDDVPEGLGRCQAMTYDSCNKVVLLLASVRVSKWALKVEAWKMDPASGKFSKLPPPAGEVPQGGSVGRWGTFWYDPDHNACLLVAQLSQGGHEGSPCQTWAYRYKR
ncbi:MAG: RNA polymerase sigma factor [Planctomycetota bacterium]|jgi:RNA polymerase sigma factor (sigma-70 family)